MLTKDESAKEIVHYLHTYHLVAAVKASDADRKLVWDVERRPFGQREIKIAQIEIQMDHSVMAIFMVRGNLIIRLKITALRPHLTRLGGLKGILSLQVSRGRMLEMPLKDATIAISKEPCIVHKIIIPITVKDIDGNLETQHYHAMVLDMLVMEPSPMMIHTHGAMRMV